MMQSTSDASPASSSSSPSSSSRTPKRKPRPLHLRGTSTPTTGQSHLPAQPQVYGHELDGQEQVEDSRDEHDLHPATAGDHRQSRIMAHPPQQIYVLSADGSSLFLLDPTKPHGNEEPPPYMPFHDPAVETGIGETETPGLHIGGLHGHGHSMDPGGRETEAGREVGIGQNTNPAASLTQAPSRTNAGFDSGPSPRIGDRPPSTPRAAHVHRPLQIYRIDSNGALAQGGSSDIYAPTNTHYLDDPVQASSSRHRASTLSALQPRTRIPLSGVSGHRYSASIHGSIQTSTRPGYRTSTSYSSTTPVARSRDRRHARSAVSSPGNRTAQLLPDGTIDMDESTPLLGRAHTEIPGSGLWRSIFCGDLDVDTGETRQLSWGVGWKRFWRPIVRKEYWRAVLHLAVLNFPFALLVWPFLLAGTLAGTALLITLPIGVAVWWLTLFIARSAARLEVKMQLHFHQAQLREPHLRRPIFHRLKERSIPNSPASITFEQDVEYGAVLEYEEVWEKQFIKCSYAMFADHYSYSALSYFLLIKAVITLFSTIAIIAFLPISFVGVITLPIYLRGMRRWGKWQAGVALDNL